MADNGRPFPRDKTRMYNSGILTPFIVHYPNGVKKTGKTSNSLISVIDIAPTIVELTGSKESDMFQGKSFLKLLKKPNSKFRHYAFAEHNWHDYRSYERMVRNNEYVYIENGLPEQSNIGAADVLNGGAGQSMIEGNKAKTLNELQSRIFKIPQPKAELYDYKKDPNQYYNLINKKEFQEVRKTMKSVLDEWCCKTRDSQPKNITPDWYDRKTIKPLKIKGTRGEMPGKKLGAEKIDGTSCITDSKLQ